MAVSFVPPVFRVDHPQRQRPVAQPCPYALPRLHILHAADDVAVVALEDLNQNL